MNPEEIDHQEELKNGAAKNSTFKHRTKQEPSQSPINLRRYRWWVISILVLLLIAISSSSLFWWYATSFESQAKTELIPLILEAKEGARLDVYSGRSRINFLILGLDEVQNRQEGSQLTDTMMLISLNKNGTATAISLPRDLWVNSLRTKINALYYYGQESDQTNGEELVKTVIQDITGAPIDYTLLIKLDTLENVIDATGGVTVNIPHGFTDTQFPRDDVDLATANPSELYETISFEPGVQLLNGETAMKYIRSRHSDDLTEGTDLARSARQQLIIKSLMQQIAQVETISDPNTLGKLYYIWDQEIETNLSNKELFSILRHIGLNQIEFQTTAIPVAEDDISGIIQHPPTEKYDQWVYEPVDPTWDEFSTWVQQTLQ